MNLRCRKSRPLTREDRTYRDDRLFVIATEDTYAPEQYFEIFKNPRIKVLVLPTTDGRSSPKQVLQRLDDHLKTFDAMEEDEFWLVLDTDHWVEPNHVPNFAEVCAEAVKRQLGLAHSNPCFEVWLLLHVTELEAGEQLARAADAEERLRQALGTYNKRNIDRGRFPLETAKIAIDRAKKLDDSPGDRWPQKTGSHVYRIVEKLLQGVQ